jgi:hypothetical protein
VLDADAVALTGGGDGARASGKIALALHKPVVVIAHFGGAAVEMLKFPTAEEIATLELWIGEETGQGTEVQAGRFEANTCEGDH